MIKIVMELLSLMSIPVWFRLVYTMIWTKENLYKLFLVAIILCKNIIF